MIAVPVIFLFYGFGYRIVDIYHVFEWNARFGKTGEVLVVVSGILGLFVFWALVTFILVKLPLRYAVYYIFPVTISFPVAFALTPFGHLSLLMSLFTFSSWGMGVFVLVSSVVIGVNKMQSLSSKGIRKPLDSLPVAERVTQKDLQNSKKYRYGLQKFLKKLKKYGSLDTLRRSIEYDPKFDIYIADYRKMNTEMMVKVDVDIAIAEYSLTKDVAKFRRELSAAYRALWETRGQTTSPVSSENFPRIANDIFHSLAALDAKQAEIQAVFLLTAIRNLRIRLHYVDEAVYIAIIAAVRCDSEMLQNAAERLRKGLSFYARLFENYPGYWLPYLTGLADKDVSLCNEGIRIYAEEHYHRVSQDPDSQYFMNIQALGMANLCRIHGIDVAAIPPIIPEDLIFKSDNSNRDIFDLCFLPND